MESMISRRGGMFCVTTGPGGAPTRTAITSGDVEPSWPSTSTEMGVMVISPLEGALAGTITVAVMVTSFPDGMYVCVMIVSIGVIQPGALCMRKPSFATPIGWTAWSFTVSPAAAVALSVGRGARNLTFGPVAMRMATFTVSA